MFKDILLVGLGGFFGSMLRFTLSSLMVLWLPQTFIPVGTLTVNIIGSLLVGILASTISNNTLYLIAVLGFCGGFTTFSTFSFEVFGMVRLGAWGNAMTYVLVSFAVCVSFAGLGFWICERYIMNKI